MNAKITATAHYVPEKVLTNHDLEKLIDTAQGQDLDVSEAAAVLADISRFFHNSVHWSQNDAWYLELRHRIAKQIVRLQARLR